MKKWGFLFVTLVLLGYIIFQQVGKIADASPIRISPSMSFQEKYISMQISQDQIYQGDLLLVNSKYPVQPEGVQSDVIRLTQDSKWVNGYNLLETDISLSEHVAQSFAKMVKDANQDQVNHFSMNSGYRNFDKQSQLYEEKGSDYALPAGFSEHNMGLSLDIGSTQMEMNQAPEGKWLMDHAWKYGFVLRYPKDKTAITGIQYEPWHYRYVGLPHSAIMNKRDMVLEQYLEYVKKEKSFTYKVDGETYEVTYYPVNGNTDIQVPVDRSYTISGNNIDGVIVTVYPK